MSLRIEMSELENVQRNIEMQLESNRLAWQEVAEELDRQKRMELKKAIFERSEELFELFNLRDELRNSQDD